MLKNHFDFWHARNFQFLSTFFNKWIFRIPKTENAKKSEVLKIKDFQVCSETFSFRQIFGVPEILKNLKFFNYARKSEISDIFKISEHIHLQTKVCSFLFFSIIKKSGQSSREFDILLLRLLNYVKIIPTHIIVKYREKAFEIIGKIDSDDVIFIATAMAFNALIWSDDKHFKKQKFVRVLNTKEIIKLC